MKTGFLSCTSAEKLRGECGHGGGEPCDPGHPEEPK